MTIFRSSIGPFAWAVLVLACTSTAQAAERYFPANFVNSKELNENCNAPFSDAAREQKRALCDAYVIGIVDAHSALNPFGSKSPRFCLSTRVVRGQAPAIVAKWLRENDWSIGDFGSDLVIQILSQTFPCGGPK